MPIRVQNRERQVPDVVRLSRPLPWATRSHWYSASALSPDEQTLSGAAFRKEHMIKVQGRARLNARAARRRSATVVELPFRLTNTAQQSSRKCGNARGLDVAG